MKVFLLNPPYLKNFIRSSRCTWLPISGSNWYPIFLAYTTGWLENHGHDVKLVDAPVAGFTPSEIFNIAQKFNPELLVLYVSEQSLKNDIRIGEKIKKITRCEIVLVGPWCATAPKKILQKNLSVDEVVKREFDDVVLDLANGKDKKQIKGLVYRHGKKVIENPEREFLDSKYLDKFPFVTQVYKNHLPVTKYHQASLLHPFVDLFTARGCTWGKCTYCLWPHTIQKGASYRARSLDNVIDELKYIKKELPFVKEVFIQDDMLPAARARALSQAILKNKIDMKWSCYVKGDIDYQTLSLMKKSGCRYLHVGYESADNQILKNACKGVTVEKMKEFTEHTRRLGLKIHGDFIIGLPGENRETIRKTIIWAKNLRIEGYQFFIPQPHESTPLYAWLAKRGFLTKKGDIDYPYFNRHQLSFWRFKAMKEIYLNPQYIFRTLISVNSFSELKRLFRTALYVVPNILFPGKFS